jgi:hypothetical protein
MRESLIASARAFDELLSFLREQQRVPSFREYRARCAVEQITKRENESEQQFLMRIASRYYVLYQHWPLPSDQTNFGPQPAGFEPQKWPATPPPRRHLLTKGTDMKIDDLKAKREKLTARLKQLDAEIARAERVQREQEQREMLKLLQLRGITASQLEELLNASGGNEKDDMPAQ